MGSSCADTCAAWKTEIEGKYAKVRSWELAAVWGAYQARVLQAVDLRVWLAAHEVALRRGTLGEGRVPEFNLKEFQGLVGRDVSEVRLRASLRRLEKLGICRVRRRTITFAEAPGSFFAEAREASETVLRYLPHRKTGEVRAWFPLPRRMLRVLAAGVKRNVFATVLGQCAYCIYRNGNAWTEEGRVKASTLAQAFGLSEKSIYRGRQHLVEVGFLARVAGYPASAKKLWGERMAVNLAWKRRLSSERELSTGQLSTRLYQAPSSKISNHQEPRSPGVYALESEPSWRNIKREDLESNGRRLKLYASAVSVGAIADGARPKLNFLGACERARHRGTTNPCGLLRWLVERNECLYVSNDEEEAARKALRTFEDQDLGGRGKDARFTVAGTALSLDARFVQGLRRDLERRRVFEDPFPHLHGARPDWTRERWERACLELTKVGTERLAA